LLKICLSAATGPLVDDPTKTSAHHHAQLT
jgi:hypothetical protein